MSHIRFDTEASCWNEALPVGNGFIGAMVFGGTGVERIQLNEDSLWSGGPLKRVNPNARENLENVRRLLFAGDVEEAELLARRSMLATSPHMRHYQTLGDIWIDFNDARAAKRIEHVDGMPYIVTDATGCSDYSRTLDLSSSLGAIDYKRDAQHHHREFFASTPDDVIAYRMDAQGAPLSFELWATRKDNRHGRGSSYCDDIHAEQGDTIVLSGSQGGVDGIGFVLKARVLVEGALADVRSMGSHLIVENAAAVTLLITARTTFRAENPSVWCTEKLELAANQSYDDLRDRAVSDYKRLFNACTLDFPANRDLENLPTETRLARMRNGKLDRGLVKTYFDCARYLLISSSRPGSLPSTLQGIWNEDFEPMWGSKYTININIQMNYWMAEATGLGELHLPLIEHLQRMVPAGSEIARTMYGARGFCAHHNTDIWGDCAPQDAHLTASVWPMGAAWLALDLVEHWRYVRDTAFLKRFYPVLAQAVQFFIDYMVHDRHGYWVTGPSVSPENTYAMPDGRLGNLCMGPTMDTQIVRELFEGYLGINKDIKATPGLANIEVDEELASLTAEHLAGLHPMSIGSHGQICEWAQDYDEPDPGHRHISQLFGLYPAAQIRPDRTPDLARAAEVTLERRLSHGGGHTGWSKAWIILLYDRLGKGEQAWKNLVGLLANATLPNLLDNHPPFQIDGNFGGAAGVLEMLVRDYGDTTWLLPALPEALDTGSIRGVHLMCGAVLDLEWRAGRVVHVCIQGGRDGTARIHLPCGQQFEVPLHVGSRWEQSF